MSFNLRGKWAYSSTATVVMGHGMGRGGGQGLTLVHCSAQPEPFLTLNTSPKRLNTPSNPALNNA